MLPCILVNKDFRKCYALPSITFTLNKPTSYGTVYAVGVVTSACQGGITRAPVRHVTTDPANYTSISRHFDDVRQRAV